MFLYIRYFTLCPLSTLLLVKFSYVSLYKIFYIVSTLNTSLAKVFVCFLNIEVSKFRQMYVHIFCLICNFLHWIVSWLSIVLIIQCVQNETRQLIFFRSRAQRGCVNKLIITYISYDIPTLRQRIFQARYRHRLLVQPHHKKSAKDIKSQIFIVVIDLRKSRQIVQQS